MKRKITLHALAAIFFIVGCFYLYKAFGSPSYGGGLFTLKTNSTIQECFYSLGRSLDSYFENIANYIVASASLILATLTEILNALLDRKKECSEKRS